MWRKNTGDARGAEPWRDRAAASPEWKAVPRLTNWESWGDPALAEFNGMLFYRTSITLTRAQAAQPATLDIGWADDLDQTWVNEVPVGNTYGPNSSRAYVLPPGTLREGENNIVVSVLDLWGQGGMAGPEDLRALRLADGSSVPLKGPWRYRVASREGSWPPRAPWESVAGLSTIYNGMVAPLGRYGLTGVAWYQGESDASTERGYAAKLGSMMADWRTQFGKPDLPFLVVQLAGFGPSPATPQDSGFATVRDEQRRAVAADRNAGLAVAIDLGDRRDIHPANKQDVGLRLARAARHVAYGEKITPSGPEVATARVAGGEVVVDFRNIDGALVTYNSDRAIGFELCAKAPGSCRFVTGNVAGNSVRLGPAAGNASRVRFCWGDSPVCNLYDRSGLPAGPFEIEIAAQPR
jgi:sialate O-acetylesterase